MRTRSLLLAALGLLLPLASACDRSSQSSAHTSDGTAIESSRADDREKSSSPVFEGQLRSVDPERKTLIVAFADDLYEFAYTDATEVYGGTENARGLTGNTGNQITVHYRQNPITSTKTAVRIELQ
jgi:ABC-type amino acid transport substrate-binding protein